MPFEFATQTRTAIIGGGISGLAAAYELASSEPVVLFEAESRLGGHARTKLAGRNCDVPVDTGFIVFNYQNYPHLTRMFSELDVPVKKSNMSFAASIGNGAIEYGLNSFGSMTAQTRNMVRPQFWRMISDIVKFNNQASALAENSDLSLGELLDRLQMGAWFRRYYLLPLSGAIWSSTPEQMQSFPAHSLVQFFKNHALMSYRNHQWYTVDGGSIEYVRRIRQAIETRGGAFRTGCPVKAVRRHEHGVELRLESGEWEYFDKVIFACHSDDALRLLERPTTKERQVLGGLRYQSNRAVLHCDPVVMPKRTKCWASWVFNSPEDRPSPSIGVTYWMNSLQGIKPDDPIFLSLNSPFDIRPEAIYDEVEFRHPVFDAAAIRAQCQLADLQGQNRTYFCGAYAKWGFHEDGYASAMDVVQRIRAKEPVI
ncbi:MAG: FAD-dependent oxidoreductase [Paracoccaceae bacterium]